MDADHKSVRVRGNALTVSGPHVRKTQARTIGILILLACLQTAVPPSVRTAEQPVGGGSLRFGVENEFAGFDVLASGSRLAINGSIANNTIQETLFRMDRQDHLIPVLGLSATPSADGKHWTVRLRQKVRFQDGTPFNADAVEKIDASTVRFHLKHAWVPFLKSISGTRSLSAFIPSPAAVEKGVQDRVPVGTGPFMLKEWLSGDRSAASVK